MNETTRARALAHLRDHPGMKAEVREAIQGCIDAVKAGHEGGLPDSVLAGLRDLPASTGEQLVLDVALELCDYKGPSATIGHLLGVADDKTAAAVLGSLATIYGFRLHTPT